VVPLAALLFVAAITQPQAVNADDGGGGFHGRGGGFHNGGFHFLAVFGSRHLPTVLVEFWLSLL